MRKIRQRLRAGSAVIEFALTLPILISLTLGVFMMGLTVVRGISVVQVTRDTAQMFARGLNFAYAGNQDVVVRLAAGLGMTRTGGNGVVILSQVMYVGDQQCAAGGFPVGDTRCTNRYWPVIIRRIVIGNASLRQSNFGTPNPSLIGSEGWLSQGAYLTDVSTRAVGFLSLIPDMAPGQLAYMVESYFWAPELSLAGMQFGGGVYSRSIF